MGFNKVAISDVNSQGRGGLGGEVKVADEAGLHEVVRAAAVHQNDHGAVSKVAQ